MDQSSGAILLAAGHARRFGSDKRAQPTPGGKPLLLVTAEKYVRVFERVLIVVKVTDKDWDERLRREMPSAEVIRSRNAYRGMGYSLADGAKAAIDWRFAFVGLADMPFVTEATLRTLHDWMRCRAPTAGPSIVRPRYRGKPGHPVGFSRHFFEELTTLSGDAGAQSVLAAHRNDVEDLEFDDPGVVNDVDRPSDLR